MDELYEVTLLERAASHVVYPATPDRRGRVPAAIGQSPAASPSMRRTNAQRPRLQRAFAAIVAAVAVVGSAIVLGVPASRSAIAEFFGIEGSEVEILPSPAPG